MAKPEVLVVIPARGGSKGLPRKNVLSVGGIPLIGRAVIAARSAARVSRVIVSTDDPEITEVAHRYGAEIVQRPEELSGDTASSESAVIHALDVVAARDGYQPDIVVLMQCTSPFVIAEDIDGTVDQILEHGADSAFAAAAFHHFLWRQGADGRVSGINHGGGRRQRRQDLREQQYLEAGSVYGMRVASFRTEGHRFCGKVHVYPTAPHRCLEIDDEQDLRRAERLADLNNHGAPIEALPRRISCIVFDFDGVFTDNKVYVSETGDESVICDRGDGMGISLLKEAGVPMLVLSKEQNTVVGARCRKLGIPVMQGVDDKAAALGAWLREGGLAAEGLIYVGNDINDAGCLAMAACAVGPCDSHPDVLHLLDIRLERHGGKGAVREFADLVLRARNLRRTEILRPATGPIAQRSA